MALEETRLVKWMKLGMVKGLGPKKIQQLVEILGSLESAFDAHPHELLNTRVFKESMLPEWKKLKEASDENFLKPIRECFAHNIQIITLIDTEYPIKLKHMPSPPMTLFLWGDSSLLEGKKIAIVGTRQPSDEARKLAFEFAKYFADSGMIIVSGGAEGIDTAVHEGALTSDSGKTICVLGTGFFHPYPQKNAPLFEKIRDSNGLLVSEYLPNFQGSRISFIQRNRITSGLSHALFIGASEETGGSMIQTEIAWEQRIPIFCPAMTMNMQPNAGIDMAIKRFNAQEVRTPQELLEKLENRGSLNAYLGQMT